MDANSVTLLSELLNPEGEEQEQLENISATSPYIHPGTIGPPPAAAVASVHNSTGKLQDTNNIWCSEDIEEAEEVSKYDSRVEPKYDMVFKQDVSTEDLFLGMTNKTPLTSACQHLLLKVYLPDTQFKDIELNITDKHVDCRTPIYHLGLYLPHPVDSNSSKARWLNQENILEVTMKVIREYDFLNT